MTTTIPNDAVRPAFSEPPILIKKYEHKNKRLTNLFELTREQLAPIFQALKYLNKQLENSKRPAAGEEFYIKMISKGKRPLEFILDAYGEREYEQEMEMPELKAECAFCNNTEKMEGYEEAGNENARVIKSVEGNPLPISNRHTRHFFELTVEEQIDITMVGIQALKIKTGGACSRAQLAFHIGVQGHQTYAHTHMHVTTSLGFKT
jgi:hypothetical protein